jgi:hypothetical protein
MSQCLHCSQHFASSRIAEVKFGEFNKERNAAAAAASRHNNGGALSDFPKLLVTFLQFLYFCRCSSVNRNVLLTKQHTADVPRSLSLYFTLWSLYRSEIPNIRTVDVDGAYSLLYRVTFALRVGRVAVGSFKFVFGL